MKSFVVFAMLVVAAVAAPQSADSQAQTLRLDNDNIGVDGYNYAYETSNGIKAQEQGQVADKGTENEGNEVRGQYEYTGLDRVVYLVTYTAGREGFKPSGAHLPQA